MLVKRDYIFFWIVMALVPSVIMGASFIFDAWTWGLMDDFGKISNLSQKNWLNTVGDIMTSHFTGQVHGRLAWLRSIYFATFYPIFKDAPQAFYFFKLLLAVATLLVWSINVRLLTKSWAGCFLLNAAAFSFYFFYDAITYLSTHEIIGVFFLGFSLMALIVGLILPSLEQRPISRWWILMGWVLAFLATGVKEPFVFAWCALGVALGVWAIARRRMDLGICAVFNIVSAVAYAGFLKFFIQKSYSARYDFFNAPIVMQNFKVWFHDVAPFHLPWIILIAVIIVVQKLRKSGVFTGPSSAWGAIAGGMIYVFYLLSLLPWQANSYHTVPLGVFFAFTAAVVCSKFFEESSAWVFKGIAVGGLIFEILVCSHSFAAMADYRNDTQKLIAWTGYNHQFQKDIAEGWDVATNANEPGHTLPQMINKQFGYHAPTFSGVFRVKDILCNPKVIYYLYDPKLGDQDLRRIKFMWSVVFESKSWILFRRSVWVDVGC